MAAAQRRLTFGRAGSETLHDAALKNSDEQDERNRTYHNGGSNWPPWRFVDGGTAKCRYAGGNGFHPVVRHKGEREKKFVPGEDEDENRGGRERRRRQRQNDPPENLQPAETVHLGRVFDVARNRAKKCGQHDD